MDVLSLEHQFGNETETSIQKLFIFFCNNIRLGQWQLAKACIKQLEFSKKSFNFNLNDILNDIIDNPTNYKLEYYLLVLIIHNIYYYGDTH